MVAPLPVNAVRKPRDHGGDHKGRPYREATSFRRPPRL